MNGSNAVGRTSYALMSLAAAIPGLILAAALTLAFLRHADTMPGLLPVVAGIAWLVAVLMAVTPIGILLFGGSKAARADQPKGAVAAPAAGVEDVDEGYISEESEELVEVADDDWNEGDSAVDFTEADGDEFEFDDELSGEFDADFDFDDDAKR